MEKELRRPHLFFFQLKRLQRDQSRVQILQREKKNAIKLCLFITLVCEGDKTEAATVGLCT